MKAKDKTEEILKSIHVLFSKAEPVEGSKKKVIIDKERMLNLIKSLNDCMYAMMDEYEISEQAKEKALRQVQKQSDEMIFDARKNAEDIYAASFMYTDRALEKLKDIIDTSEADLDRIHEQMKESIHQNVQAIKDNQLDLKNHLASLIETQKYLKLIENENKRLQREAEKQKELESEWGQEPAKKIEPEIIINEEYFKNKALLESQEDDIDPELSAQLDAEYFDWQDEDSKETDKSEEKQSKAVIDKDVIESLSDLEVEDEDDIEEDPDEDEKEEKNDKKGIFGFGRRS